MDTIMDDVKRITDKALWDFRMGESKQLIHYVRERLARQLASSGTSAQEISQSQQLLDSDVLTMGFARRFASYKRPNLLLHDRERLTRILCHPTRPVQLIVAGKAHPRDEQGKAMIREWSDFILHPEVRPHVIFLADYDMALTEQLVQGVDLWINTPRRPWEASGTSGMKVLVNGGLNLSVRDGWWAEAYRPEVGWAIRDGQEHGDDPGWDAEEAQQIYKILEQEIIPCFYDRDDNDIPREWVARMRTSMAELIPCFSTNRMIREYVERLYIPAANNYQNRVIDRTHKAELIYRWYDLLEKQWYKIRFGKLDICEENSYYYFEVIVHFAELDPDAVSVQIYADPLNTEKPEIHSMIRGEVIDGTETSYHYSSRIMARRPVADYTPRIIPVFEGLAVPLEARQILWYK